MQGFGRGRPAVNAHRQRVTQASAQAQQATGSGGSLGGLLAGVLRPTGGGGAGGGGVRPRGFSSGSPVAQGAAGGAPGGLSGGAEGRGSGRSFSRLYEAMGGLGQRLESGGGKLDPGVLMQRIGQPVTGSGSWRALEPRKRRLFETLWANFQQNRSALAQRVADRAKEGPGHRKGNRAKSRTSES